MALVIDSNIIDVVGASGVSIAKEIVGGASGTVFWQAEEAIYQNGTLASGITASNFTTRDGYLFVSVGADNHEEADNSARLENVDLTNYSKLDIVVDYNTYANYGDSSVSYGIDNCWTTGLPNSNNNVVTTTITIDVSS